MRTWHAAVLAGVLTAVAMTLLLDRGAPMWAALAVAGLITAVLVLVVPSPPPSPWAVAVVDRDGAMEMAGTEVYSQRFDAVIHAAFAAAEEERCPGGRRRYVVVQLRESGRTL
jgi:hypothetical protein